MCFSTVAYLAYGKDIESAVTLNLPENSASMTVQFGYCVALLFTYPLQLFPATNVMESYWLPESSLHNPKMKWKKNLLRVCIVFCTGGVAMAAGGALNNFVALAG